MEGLLSLLIFAGLFFIMMRFGCGAHMLHGHGSSKSNNDDIDPVCQKKIESDRGYGMMHKGTLFRFCSRECMDKFEQEPGRYLINNAKEKEL